MIAIMYGNPFQLIAIIATVIPANPAYPRASFSFLIKSLKPFLILSKLVQSETHFLSLDTVNALIKKKKVVVPNRIMYES